MATWRQAVPNAMKLPLRVPSVVGSELEVQHRVPASSPVADLALCRGNLVGGRSYDEFGLR